MAFANTSQKPFPFDRYKKDAKRLAGAIQNDGDENTVDYGFGRRFDGDAPVDESRSADLPGPPDNRQIASVENTGLGTQSSISTDDENAPQVIRPKPTLDEEIAEEESLMYDRDKRNDPRNKMNRWKAGAQMAMKNVGDVLMNGGSWAQAIGAGIGSFGGGAINPKAAVDLKRGQKLAWLYKRREQEKANEDRQLQRAMKKLAMENTIADNQLNLAKLDETRQDRLRKVEDRVSRERTARMTQVAGMFKNIPSYDPNDPKFAELTEALGDVNLPITPKDAKKKVDLKQDQRTGEWTVILTNPLDGKQEVRTVTKDGQPYRSTPTVVMQGEYGLTRQNDQQAFTADQNERQRAFTLRRDAILSEMRKKEADYNAAIQAQQKETDAARREEYRQKSEQAKRDLAELQSDLRMAEEEAKKNK